MMDRHSADSVMPTLVEALVVGEAEWVQNVYINTEISDTCLAYYALRQCVTQGNVLNLGERGLLILEAFSLAEPLSPK